MIGPVNNILELKATLDEIEKQTPGKVKRVGLDEKGYLVTSEKTIEEEKPSYLNQWAWVRQYKTTSFTPCETGLLVQLKKWAPQLENELSREGVTAGFPEIKRLVDRACTPIHTPAPIVRPKAPRPKTTATLSQGTTDPISRVIKELPKVNEEAIKLGRCIKTMVKQPGQAEQQVNEAINQLQEIRLVFSQLKTEQAVQDAYILCQHCIPKLPHGSADCVEQGYLILENMLAEIHQSNLDRFKPKPPSPHPISGVTVNPPAAAVSPSAGKTGPVTPTPQKTTTAPRQYFEAEGDVAPIHPRGMIKTGGVPSPAQTNTPAARFSKAKPVQPPAGQKQAPSTTVATTISSTTHAVAAPPATVVLPEPGLSMPNRPVLPVNPFQHSSLHGNPIAVESTRPQPRVMGPSGAGDTWTPPPATEPKPDYRKMGARPKQKLPQEVHQTAIPATQDTFTFPVFPGQEESTQRTIRVDKLAGALTDILTFLTSSGKAHSPKEDSGFFNLPGAVEEAMTDIYQPDDIKVCFDEFFNVLQSQNMEGAYVEFFEDNLVQLKEAKLQSINNEWKKLFKQTLEIFIKQATTGSIPEVVRDFAAQVALKIASHFKSEFTNKSSYLNPLFHYLALQKPTPEQWLKIPLPVQAALNLDINEIRQQQLMRQMPISPLKRDQTILLKPLPETTALTENSLPVEIQRIHHQFSSEKGLFFRCIGFNEMDYFTSVRDLEARRFTNPERAFDSIQLYRPATNIARNHKVTLFTHDELVVAIDRDKVSHWAIYKQNAYTNPMKGQSREASNRMADRRAERSNTKRLHNLEALHAKRSEVSNRFAMMDPTMRTSGHFRLKGNPAFAEWQPEKRVHQKESSRLVYTDNAPMKHNEVVLGTIPPTSVSCNTLYIPPKAKWQIPPLALQAKRLAHHQDLEHQLARAGSPEPRPIIIYDCNRGKLIESGFISDLLPENMRRLSSRDMEAAFTAVTRKLSGVCLNLHIHENKFWNLMTRFPLKKQLEFLAGCPDKNAGFNQDGFIDYLWENLMKGEGRLSNPADIEHSIQEIIEKGCYLPQSKEDLKQCLVNRQLPENQNKGPEQVARSGLICQAVIESLETQGYRFSDQEKTLLTYAALFNELPGRPDHRIEAALRGQCDPVILKTVCKAMGNCSAKGPVQFAAADSREPLFRWVLISAQQMQGFCTGYQPHSADPETSKWMIAELSIPGELAQSGKFMTILHNLVRGVSDLIETTGAVTFDRGENSFSKRHNLKSLQPASPGQPNELTRKRQQKFREAATPWGTIQEQLNENFKRNLCKAADRPATQTIQLAEVDMPPKWTLLDKLSFNEKKPDHPILPLVNHIRTHDIPKPTHNIEHRLKGHPTMQETIVIQNSLHPDPAWLASIESPSREEAVKTLEQQQG